MFPSLRSQACWARYCTILVSPDLELVKWEPTVGSQPGAGLVPSKPCLGLLNWDSVDSVESSDAKVVEGLVCCRYGKHSFILLFSDSPVLVCLGNIHICPARPFWCTIAMPSLYWLQNEGQILCLETGPFWWGLLPYIGNRSWIWHNL